MVCWGERFHSNDNSHGWERRHNCEQWSTMCPKTTCVSTSETNKPELATQQVQPSSDKLWLCSLLRLTTSLPHALHTDSGRKTTERPPCVCGQSMQKSKIDQAHVILHRDDNRLSKTPECSIVTWVPIASPIDDFYHAQFRRKEFAWTKVDHDILQTKSKSEETLDLVVGPPQVGGVHPVYGPNSRHEIERRQSNNFFLPCAFSVLTKLSVTAADGGTPATNGSVKAKSKFHKHRSRKPLRSLCVGRWKDSKWYDKFTSCYERSTWNSHLKANFTPIILPIIIFPSFAHQMILIVASWLFSHDEHNLDSELWENSGATRVSVRRTRRRNKLRTARLKSCLEKQLERAIQTRKYSQSHDCISGLWSSSVRTSLGAPKQRSLDTTHRSILALSYSCDNSWGALQEFPWKLTRKVEGQKRPDRGDQEAEDSEKYKEWDAARWTQSSWSWTTSSSSSAWQEWSPDEACERSDWQSADLDSSDHTRKKNTWQSHLSWQWGHRHRSSQGPPSRRKWRLFVWGQHFSIPATCPDDVRHMWHCHPFFLL